jgi:hypothetical protein
VSQFCRHNRFISECPICSKGTVLDPNKKSERRPRQSSTARRRDGTGRAPAAGARVSRGPFAAAAVDENGREVRLEKVPGGLRLAAWHAGQLAREAPVVALSEVPAMLRSAAEQGLVAEPELEAVGEPVAGAHGASPGRAGELRDELRVERVDAERVRIARWVMRPNRGWELQDAPVLLPENRFTQALEAAAQRGVLSPGDPTG